MGYHITLSRATSHKGITAEEWRDFVATRPELKTVAEQPQFITTILDGDPKLALHYSIADKSVFVKNPDGPRLIEYMASIAGHFDATVTGDGGEAFSTPADWGTQVDWDKAPERARTPFWKRELPRGQRLMLGLILGAVLALLMIYLAPKR